MIALVAAAWGQTGEFGPPSWDLEDCQPHVIAGTVPYSISHQAIETNAAAYGAVAFAETVLLADEGKYIGVAGHNLYNVTRLPTIAACPSELQYGTAGLDLYASAGGFMIPVSLLDGDLEIRLFYAGSVTGSIVQFPSNRYLANRYMSSELYAIAAVGTAYLAPLAPLLSSDRGVQTMSGDFVIGTEVGLPQHADVAALRLGYIYSQGLYSNLNSRRAYLFATALLTDQFSLLALAKGGLERVPIGKMVGRTSLFGKNQVLRSAPPNAAAEAAGDDDVFGRIDLTTIHVAQQDIGGGYVGFSLAMAMRPDIFLHEASVTVSGGLIDVGREEKMRLFSATVGVEEMPAMPWYAVEGGRKPYFDIALFESIHIRRNVPETLVIFPYAQDATEVSFVIQFGPDAVATQP